MYICFDIIYLDISIFYLTSKSVLFDDAFWRCGFRVLLYLRRAGKGLQTKNGVMFEYSVQIFKHNGQKRRIKQK
jgi:hypothetical protein